MSGCARRLFLKGVSIMLATILDILSIIGIILLIVLICAIVVLLLVLFLPIFYRAKGSKQEREMELWVKARWLFGFITMRYEYPTPNAVIIKCLWFEIYNSAKTVKSNKQESSNDTSNINTANTQNSSEPSIESVKHDFTQEESVSQDTDKSIGKDSVNQQASEQADDVIDGTLDDTSRNLVERLKAKYEKIKYTIRSIYDKIKHIVQNITYYKNVFQDEETRQLFKHVGFRVGKIWKNVRPRKLKANIHFGTGSPDTTGYLCGVYGMLCTYLGNSVIAEPDFEQQILEGDFYVAGHITVFQLLWHSGAVLLDKNLRLFWNKLKQGGINQNGR